MGDEYKASATASGSADELGAPLLRRLAQLLAKLAGLNVGARFACRFFAFAEFLLASAFCLFSVSR